MTVLDPVLAPDAADAVLAADRRCPAVAELRGRRDDLLAEDRRRAYLTRLLRARLDLAVARAVGVPALEGEVLVEGPDAPSEVFALASWDDAATGRGRDLVDELRHLDDGLARLDAYGDALHAEISRCTEQLVGALHRRPRAGLQALTSA